MAVSEKAEAVELGAGLIQLAAKVMKPEIEVELVLLVLVARAIRLGILARVVVIANSRPRFLSFHFATARKGSWLLPDSSGGP